MLRPRSTPPALLWFVAETFGDLPITAAARGCFLALVRSTPPALLAETVGDLPITIGPKACLSFFLNRLSASLASTFGEPLTVTAAERGSSSALFPSTPPALLASTFGDPLNLPITIGPKACSSFFSSSFFLNRLSALPLTVTAAEREYFLALVPSTPPALLAETFGDLPINWTKSLLKLFSSSFFLNRLSALPLPITAAEREYFLALVPSTPPALLAETFGDLPIKIGPKACSSFFSSSFFLNRLSALPLPITAAEREYFLALVPSTPPALLAETFGDLPIKIGPKACSSFFSSSFFLNRLSALPLPITAAERGYFLALFPSTPPALLASTFGDLPINIGPKACSSFFSNRLSASPLTVTAAGRGSSSALVLEMRAAARWCFEFCIERKMARCKLRSSLNNNRRALFPYCLIFAEKECPTPAFRMRNREGLKLPEGV